MNSKATRGVCLQGRKKLVIMVWWIKTGSFKGSMRGGFNWKHLPSNTEHDDLWRVQLTTWRVVTSNIHLEQYGLLISHTPVTDTSFKTFHDCPSISIPVTHARLDDLYNGYLCSPHHYRGNNKHQLITKAAFCIFPIALVCCIHRYIILWNYWLHA